MPSSYVPLYGMKMEVRLELVCMRVYSSNVLLKETMQPEIIKERLIKDSIEICANI